MLQKYAAKPMQTLRGYSSSAPYVGPGAPSSMYMGVQPYGSSVFNGGSVPPYNVPVAGNSGFQYNYNTRLPGGSPYHSPLRLSGPAPYSNGSVMGSGTYTSQILIC